MRYDPEVAQEAGQWLAFDEELRIQLCEAHHRFMRVKLPSIKAHAALHVIVENQIAEGLEPVVRAMDRLVKEGLSRHEALHAVGTAVAEHFVEALNAKDQVLANTAQARYNAAVERITAKSWRQQYGGG
jgi:aryl-alcohol dehydrogenase-like predicted oxidoreductase